MQNTLQKLLNISDDKFLMVKQAFKESEENDIVNAVIYKIIKGNTLAQAVKDISGGNDYLTLRIKTKFLYLLKYNKSQIISTFINMFS